MREVNALDQAHSVAHVLSVNAWVIFGLPIIPKDRSREHRGKRSSHSGNS
jgi:hypothetical protein